MIDIIVDEKNLTFNRLEKEIYAFGCQIAREMLKNIGSTINFVPKSNLVMSTGKISFKITSDMETYNCSVFKI